MTFWKRRERKENELDEEVRGHLERAAAEGRERGLGEKEAQTAARREFGNVELVKETARDVWGLRWLEELAKDARYAWRMLKKSPGFAGTVILTLALGIGANTAIFSVVNAVLLRPMPYPQPDQLVTLRLVTEGGQTDSLTPADFLDFQRESRSFAHLAAFREVPCNLAGGDRPERVSGVMVTSDFFGVLGIAALRGRTISPEIERPGANIVAVLSYGLWQQRFGGDPRIAGKAVEIDGEMRTVVGVMPKGFAYPAGAQLWTSSRFAMIPHPLEPLQDPSALRDTHYFEVLGRLKEGATISQASAEVNSIAQRLKQQFGDEEEGNGARVIPPRSLSTKETRPALLILLGAAGLVLLIACVNVANIVLARGTARRKEFAIRGALGANRPALLRQLLVESLLLAVAGGGAGMLLAFWTLNPLRRLVPESVLDGATIQMDWRVLAFAGAVSVASGILFGLIPGLKFSKWNENDALKESGRGTSAGRGTQKIRKALMISEITIATVLLTGAGLLILSFGRLLNAPKGFDTERVMSLQLSLSQGRYPNAAARNSFVNAMMERTEAIPGISSAGVVSRLPLNPGSSTRSIEIEGRTSDRDDVSPEYLVVTPGYFRTMGIPLRSGRLFIARDTANSAPVVIVSRSLAEEFWPGQDPVGQHVKIGRCGKDDQWCEVAGVVGDVRQHELGRKPQPTAYVPYARDPWAFFSVVARTKMKPEGALAAVESAIQRLDADQPVYNARAMEEVESESVSPQRLQWALAGLFALLALVLACLGIYGVMAQFVAQRTPEIGVRMTLGAQGRDVTSMILKEGLRLSLWGTAAGLVGSFFLMQILSALLFGVSPRNPLIYCGVAVTLTVVALAACWIPARRATRVDPMVALRHD